MSSASVGVLLTFAPFGGCKACDTRADEHVVRIDPEASSAQPQAQVAPFHTLCWQEVTTAALGGGGFRCEACGAQLSWEPARPLLMPEEANRSWRLRHSGCQQGLGPGDKTLTELSMPSKQTHANASSVRWWLLCLVAAAGTGCSIYTVLISHGSRKARKLDEPINDIGWTPLMLAAQQGQVELVGQLLRAGVNSEFADGSGWTPLMLGAFHGQETVVRQLLDVGVAINTRKSDHFSAVMLAADRGHLHIVKVLLAAGADPNARGANGWTALMLVCAGGADSLVQELLSAGASTEAATENEGWTALILAVQNGHNDVLARLLRASAAPDLASLDGVTPMMRASGAGNVAAVRSLLAAGGDPRRSYDKGWTSLLLAARQGHEGVVRVLLEAGGGAWDADEEDDAVTSIMLVVGADAAAPGVEGTGLRLQRVVHGILQRTTHGDG